MVRGRHSEYTPELGQRIADAMAMHEGGLRSLCKENEDFPEPATIYKWRTKFVDFDDMFTAARDRQLAMYAEDIVDTSMDESLEPNARRLIVDTKKWLLTKLMHRTYGDKLDVTSDGQALATAPHLIDARVQSIIMQARMRRAEGVDLEALDANALKLLD